MTVSGIFYILGGPGPSVSVCLLLRSHGTGWRRKRSGRLEGNRCKASVYERMGYSIMRPKTEPDERMPERRKLMSVWDNGVKEANRTLWDSGTRDIETRTPPGQRRE